MVYGGYEILTMGFVCSRPDQEEQQEPADQVQGPLPEVPLHPGPQGLGEGREAQAEPAAQ